jgi:hypothetical protein
MAMKISNIYKLWTLSILCVKFQCLIADRDDNIFFLTKSGNELNTSIIHKFSTPTKLDGLFGVNTENLYILYTELCYSKEFSINKIELLVGGRLRAGISVRYDCEVYQRKNEKKYVVKLIFYFDAKIYKSLFIKDEILINMSFLTDLGIFYEVYASPGNYKFSDLGTCFKIVEINKNKLIFRQQNTKITGGFLVFQEMKTFYDLSNNLLKYALVETNSFTGKEIGTVELQIKNREGKQGYIVFFKDVVKNVIYKVVYTDVI